MAITTVGEIMTSVVEVLGIGDTLARARQQIARGRIRHLPVVDGNEHLVGLITHRRILESRRRPRLKPRGFWKRSSSAAFQSSMVGNWSAS
jgi:CBS domain-containing protein